MRRGEAGKLVSRCDYLTAADKSVFRTLLERANNDDCKIPPFQTPTVPELILATSLHRATVFRSMTHLETHKWMVRTAGKGRGHKSSYALVVEQPDTVCQCQKVAPGDPLGPKRSHPATGKVALLPESSQVEPRFDTRDSREQRGVEATTRCDLCPSTPSRIDKAGARYCVSCAPHLWKEPAA